MSGLFANEAFQKLQRGLIACYMRALMNYHKRALEKLTEIDRKLDIVGNSIFDRSFIHERAPPAAAPTPRNAADDGISSNDSSRAVSNVSSRNNSSNALGPLPGSNAPPPPPVDPSKKPSIKPVFPAPPVNGSSAPPVPSRGGPKAVALYNFEAVEAGDLSFVKDDVIEILKQEGDWWVGQIGSRKGNFPSNYVRLS